MSTGFASMKPSSTSLARSDSKEGYKHRPGRPVREVHQDAVMQTESGGCFHDPWREYQQLEETRGLSNIRVWVSVCF